MMKRALLGLMLLGVCSAQAQPNAPQAPQAPQLQTQAAPVVVDDLPPAKPLLPPDNAASWTFKPGKSDGADALQVVPVEGQSFARALRITTGEKTSGAEVSIAKTGLIRQGEAAMFFFWARTVSTRDETGEATGQAQLIKDGYWQKVSIPFGVGREWKRITLPFEAETNFSDDFTVRLAFKRARQTMEIGGVQLLNYGNTRAAHSLPMTSVSYPGREMNAPWRKAAAERIEKYRKSNLTVRVVDNKDQPVPNAQVSVKLKRHAFLFGTAVSLEDFHGAAPNGKKFYSYGGPLPRPDDVRKLRAWIPQLFNAVTIGDLKWAQGNGAQYHELIVPLIQSLHAQGLYTRGHVMVWPGWENLPKSLKPLQNDKPALRQAVTDRINQLDALYHGQIEEWDVANEVQWNTDLQRILGPQVLGEWFKQARANDAKPRLFLNEAFGLTWTPMHDNLLGIVQKLQAEGAPIEGIGIEAHHGFSDTNPETAYQTLDRLSQNVAHVAITEYDMSSPDEALQADYLRDLLTVTFSHPKASGFIMWGFWDGAHWKGNAPLFRRDWTPKPALKMWQGLMQQWSTNAQGTTDARGEYQTRGFLGDYEVTITANGRTKTTPITLDKAGQPLRIALP